ncbi:DNA-directed RNA polymerase I subunit RPA12 [Culicoides brevitarsis]|uniref:DNA-directed RNA polymerase I subunit RPA12 n=1 Tax=Culicoides brevitarsis TaxID=469753 RepID=UPI00307B701B
MSRIAADLGDSDVTPGFCPNCGSIFPQLRQSGNVICYTCKNEFRPEVFGTNECEYTLHFNTYHPPKEKDLVALKKDQDEDEGPIVERKCPQCGNTKMSYATLQLRSADEGQTVFFTCTKCKYKETENS